jgi:hypothetical protein
MNLSQSQDLSDADYVAEMAKDAARLIYFPEGKAHHERLLKIAQRLKNLDEAKAVVRGVVDHQRV